MAKIKIVKNERKLIENERKLIENEKNPDSGITAAIEKKPLSFKIPFKTDQFFAEARPLVFGRVGFFEFFFAIQSLGQNFWPTDWTAIFFAIQSLGQDFWPADSTIENEKKLIENERI